MITVPIAVSDGPAEWLTAIGTMALAVATVIAVLVSIRTTRTDRQRADDQRRADADALDRRLLKERRERADDDAQQNVIVEFPERSPLTQAQREASGVRGPTHEIVVTVPAGYPVKWLDARIAHRANGGISTLGAGWSFDRPDAQNGQVRYTCRAEVSGQLADPAPVVRFTDRNGTLYYSYLGFTRRFGQNTDFHQAAVEIDKWVRRGPEPDEPPA